MNIKAEKVDEDVFIDLLELIDRHEWLKEKSKWSALVELWNMCELKTQQELLKELFSRFCYLSLAEKKQTIQDIIAYIENDWHLNGDNSYIAAVGDDQEVDGSIGHLNSFKTYLPFSWQEYNLIPSIGKISYKLKEKYKPNLILFDDFIGTGKTFSRKINWLSNDLEEKNICIENIKIISFAGMKFGIDKLIEEQNIEIYAPHVLKRGISDFENLEQLEVKKELMLLLERALKKEYKGLNLKDHSLGYGQSEALYYLEDNNCSNNVFPIFWWAKAKGGRVRKTLFKRLR